MNKMEMDPTCLRKHMEAYHDTCSSIPLTFSDFFTHRVKITHILQMRRSTDDTVAGDIATLIT